MTETGPVVLGTPDGRERLSSCGVLLPQTEAKICNVETGEALGVNKTGELLVRGPQVRMTCWNTEIGLLNPTKNPDDERLLGQ